MGSLCICSEKEEMTVEENLHEQIASVLAHVYRRVDWRSMTSMKRSAADMFADRIRVASHERTPSRAVERLCRQLGLSSIKADPDDIRHLNENADEVMEMMRNDTVYLALLAQRKAREMII